VLRRGLQLAEDGETIVACGRAARSSEGIGVAGRGRQAAGSTIPEVWGTILRRRVRAAAWNVTATTTSALATTSRAVSALLLLVMWLLLAVHRHAAVLLLLHLRISRVRLIRRRAELTEAVLPQLVVGDGRAWGHGGGGRRLPFACAKFKCGAKGASWCL
jgi:uncharacterized membrane protein YgcG